MTYKEYVEKIDPEAKNLISSHCPSEYGLDDLRDCITYNIDCKRCWNREVEGWRIFSIDLCHGWIELHFNEKTRFFNVRNIKCVYTNLGRTQISCGDGSIYAVDEPIDVVMERIRGQGDVAQICENCGFVHATSKYNDSLIIEYDESQKYNYCPMCGDKMLEQENENERN